MIDFSSKDTSMDPPEIVNDMMEDNDNIIQQSNQNYDQVIDIKRDTIVEVKEVENVSKNDARIQNLESSSYQGKIIIQIIQELELLKENLEEGINVLHQLNTDYNSCITHFSSAKRKGIDIQEMLLSHSLVFDVVELGSDGVKKIDSNVIKVEPDLSIDNSFSDVKSHSDPKKEEYLDDNCHDIGFKSYDTSEEMKKETKSYHYQKFLPTRKCKHCSKHFKGRTKLLQHINAEHAELRPYQCTMCDKSYPNQHQLDGHVATHAGIKPFQCKICDARFPNRTRLKNHEMRIHSKDHPNKCEVCGKKYAYMQDLNKHMKSHEAKPKFPCNQCGKTFARLCNFEAHVSLYIDGVCHGEFPYICQECGRGFKKTQSLGRHLATHYEERPYQCNNCGKAFKTNDNLLHHMRTHQNKADRKQFPCEVCGQSFLSREILKVHMLHHTGEKPFHCDQCSKQFCTKTELNSHMVTHTNARPFKCDQCLKDYARKKDLDNHMRVHFPDKLFKCEVCDKGYTTKQGLVIHNRHHTGERPYKCEQCGEGFIQQKQLQYHTLIHTGERPYKCPICGKGFRNSSSMKTHRDRHTGTGALAPEDKLKINKIDQPATIVEETTQTFLIQKDG